MSVGELLETLSRRSLAQGECYRTFSELVGGQFTEVEMAAILAALKTRGETPAEIAGAAQAMREHAIAFPKPPYPVADTCGTGGDGTGTLNISTAAAFVTAACGVPVAKHGNRAVSSRCGSADVLEAAGVRLDPPPDVARRCLDQAGVCFLFAPAYHPGVRQAMGVRRALRTRTLFNLLGPLANPSRPEWQVMGVYDPALCRPLAETLQLLGCRAALVVHGSGLDEIALHGPTAGALLRDGRVLDVAFGPESAGLDRAPLSALAGADREESARWLARLLTGDGAPAHLAAVTLNAGALLWIAGRAASLAEGTGMARSAVAEGRPARHLELLVELSHGA